jgi:hypothetical protein
MIGKEAIPGLQILNKWGIRVGQVTPLFDDDFMALEKLACFVGGQEKSICAIVPDN